LKTAVFTLEYLSLLYKISFTKTASWAPESILKPNLLEMLETLCFRLKTLLKLEKLHVLVRFHLYLHWKVVFFTMV